MPWKPPHICRVAVVAKRNKNIACPALPCGTVMQCTVCSVCRRPPEDDGGTSIKHYVVDLLDTTTNNMWSTVAMSNTGEDRDLVIRYSKEDRDFVIRYGRAGEVRKAHYGFLIWTSQWEYSMHCVLIGCRVQLTD